MDPSPSPQKVYTLLCKRDLELALQTVPRILSFLQPDQKFVIIDDGSFDQECVDKFQALSPNVQIIERKDREEQILDILGNRPNCKSYREELAFAFKLLDIPLLAREDKEHGGGRYTYTDTDIIYIRDCGDYFNRSANTYLRTDAIKLSVKLQDALLKYRWKVPIRFNAGYLCFDTKDFDLDFVEHYLGLPDVRNNSWVSEQTCWALLFGRLGPAFAPLENQFVCREDFQGPQPDTLAIHLIAGLKGQLKGWLPYQAPGAPQTTPGFELTRNVTMLDWAQKTARRFMKRR